MPKVTITAAQLREAADLISDPRRWCVNKAATTEDGKETGVDSLNAVAWCAVGAICRVVPHIAVTTALTAIDPNRPNLSLVNDLYGHAAAVAELHRLADLAEARERAVPNA